MLVDTTELYTVALQQRYLRDFIKQQAPLIAIIAKKYTVIYNLNIYCTPVDILAAFAQQSAAHKNEPSH